jgi:hypothetical protein
VHGADNGYTRPVRRFFTTLAVYFGLTDDETPAPPPERPGLFTVVAVVIASLAAGLLTDALQALVESSEFDLADALWHGAVLSIFLLIARVVEYHVRSRSRGGTPSPTPRSRSGRSTRCWCGR